MTRSPNGFRAESAPSPTPLYATPLHATSTPHGSVEIAFIINVTFVTRGGADG